MMHTKYFEIRDRATFIPVKVDRLHASNDQERYLIAQAGYGTIEQDQMEYIIVTRLDTLEAQYAPHNWNGRTMTTAHQAIEEYFDRMDSGGLIDVEYILEEVDTPKTTQNKGGMVDGF